MGAAVQFREMQPAGRLPLVEWSRGSLHRAPHLLSMACAVALTCLLVCSSTAFPISTDATRLTSAGHHHTDG